MDVNTKRILMSGQTTLWCLGRQHSATLSFASHCTLSDILNFSNSLFVFSPVVALLQESVREVTRWTVNKKSWASIANSLLHKQTGLFELTNWAGVNSPWTFLCAFDPWSRSFHRLWGRWASWAECARTQHVLVHVQTKCVCVTVCVRVCACEGALDRITKECGLVNSQSAQKAVQSPYIYI